MDLFTLKTSSYTRLSDPAGSAIETHLCFVDAHSFPAELADWDGVNPRQQNMQSKVAIAIADSLCANDNFHYLNRGITISAEQVQLEGENLNVRFRTPHLHGVMDGGHTLSAVLQAAQDGTLPKNRYVMVEIITGIETTNKLTDISEARNMNVAVDYKSFAELAGAFEIIKVKLADEPFFDRIAFKMNENRGNAPIDITDIIAVILMFNQDFFPKNDYHIDKQMLNCYLNKQKILNRFMHFAEGDKQQRNEERERLIESMSPIIKDIFKLWETIELGMFDAIKKKDYFPKNKWFKVNETTTLTTYGQVPIPYKVPAGIVYMLLYSFTFLAKKDAGGTYFWERSPFELWEICKQSLVKSILHASHQTVAQLTRSHMAWDNLAATTYVEVLRGGGDKR